MWCRVSTHLNLALVLLLVEQSRKTFVDVGDGTRDGDINGFHQKNGSLVNVL